MTGSTDTVPLVDSHAHLDDPRFADDLGSVTARAAEAGVRRIISVGVDLASSLTAIELARTYPTVVPAVGQHPAHADRFAHEGRPLRDLATLESVRAIGEIGLDYHVGGVDRDRQREVFRQQLRWARDLNLPVIVHDREAHDDVLQDLGDAGVPGVLHCFSGDLEVMHRALKMGLYLSLAGNVTFKNARTLHEIARAVPLDRLLVETDSPALSPEPRRGRRNEPERVRLVVEKIAELRGCAAAIVAGHTVRNAERLFASAPPDAAPVLGY